MHPFFIDTHAHLCDRAFDQDREEVILRAQQAGVGTIVVVGENLEDARRPAGRGGVFFFSAPPSLVPPLRDRSWSNTCLLSPA
ncbi:MAG: TatD family hydrolase [Deltaproteobacteria bacterium]|nr:TatD family hydrolase [Deltaproteobacteria bacterium]